MNDTEPILTELIDRWPEPQPNGCFVCGLAAQGNQVVIEGNVCLCPSCYASYSEHLGDDND